MIEHGVKIVLMFVITPLMIRHLGMEDYGTWLLALTIIAYLRMLDLGLSIAGSRFLAKALGRKSEEEYCGLVDTLFKLYLWIAAAVVVVTGLIWVALPTFFSDFGNLDLVRVLVLGFGAVTAARFVTRIGEVVLKGHVRYDCVGISAIVKALLQGALVISLLKGGYGLLSLLVAHIVTDLADQGMMWWFAKRVDPSFRVRYQRGLGAGNRELLSYSATATVTNISHSLRSGIDPLIVARVSGLNVVPIYNIGVRFFTVLTDFVNAVFGGNLIAAFSQLHGRGDDSHLRKKFLDTIRYCATFAAIGVSGIALFGPAFILRWVGVEFSLSSKVIYVLGGPMLLMLAQYPVWGLFLSLSKQHILAVVTLVGGVVNLGISVFLAHRIGFMGVVWGTFIELILTYGLVVPWIVKKQIDIPLHRLLSQIAYPVLVVATVGALCWIVLREQITANYLVLGGLGTGFLAVVLIACWWLVLGKAERAEFWSLVRNRTK